MTEEEIYRNYKQAKFPSKQIQILADINGCTSKEIKDIIDKREPIPENTLKEEPKVKRAHRGRPPKSECEESKKEHEKPKAEAPKADTPIIGIPLPKSVRYAIDRRHTLLEDVISFKEKELEEARRDLKEIEEWLKAIDEGTA